MYVAPILFYRANGSTYFVLSDRLYRLYRGEDGVLRAQQVQQVEAPSTPMLSQAESP